ncbi:serine/threonine-protein kinase mrck-1-like [Dendroctonus ponderosae]|uniref:serine/threonine-protein kinase mrck-1-like n=1 Tax=Dendroctonus ponderosae TaxID=77166 RepID=UPI002035102B|nr:serine/threonine-protein kinase mrck-1-like [Dendroctonus ponderosae]
MEKLIAIQNEEQLDEQRLKETIIHRDRILKLVGEIATSLENVRDHEHKIKVTKELLFQSRTDVTMLTKQLQEIDQWLWSKLDNVLKDEEQLKKNKVSFNQSIREKIEELKQFSTQRNVEAVNHEVTDTQRVVWKLQGENDALALIKQFQISKIQEIDRVTETVPDLKEKS